MKAKPKPVKHTKRHDVLVALNDRDLADLDRAVVIEAEVRGEVIGRATLLREFAMPRVREIVLAHATEQEAA